LHSFIYHHEHDIFNVIPQESFSKLAFSLITKKFLPE